MHNAFCINSVHITADKSPTEALQKAESSNQIIYNPCFSCRDSQRRQRRARRCSLAEGAVPLQGSLQAALCPGGPGGCTDGGQSVQQPQSSAGHPGLLPHVCTALHQTPSACTCTGQLCMYLLAGLVACWLACFLDCLLNDWWIDWPAHLVERRWIDWPVHLVEWRMDLATALTVQWCNAGIWRAVPRPNPEALH